VDGLTAAVNVILWPNVAGFEEEARVIEALRAIAAPRRNAMTQFVVRRNGERNATQTGSACVAGNLSVNPRS
jgi:hypothetical protein